MLHNALQPTGHFTVMLSAITFLHMPDQQQSFQFLTILNIKIPFKKTRKINFIPGA